MSLREMSQPSGPAEPFDAYLFLVIHRNGQSLYLKGSPDAHTQQQKAMRLAFDMLDPRPRSTCSTPGQFVVQPHVHCKEQFDVTLYLLTDSPFSRHCGCVHTSSNEVRERR